jgi:hypothetical protein
MTIINPSDKFAGQPHQCCVLAGGYVILRSVLREPNRIVMTATASEEPYNGGTPSYPDQTGLLNCAHQVFAVLGGTTTAKRDLEGRHYVQTVFPDASVDLTDLAQRVATKLGLGAIEIKDEVLAALWDELRVDEFDDEERVYLSDGMYVNKDGSISRG